jgi:hypothetical protein
MGQVVELFGAPGTGKSSLARALDGRRAFGRRLVAAERLLSPPRSVRSLWRSTAPSLAERRRAVDARRADWGELLAFLASASLGREDGPALRASGPDPLRPLYAPGWVTVTLELRALADASPEDHIILIDEGFAQRAAIVCGMPPDANLLERYVRLVPSPLLHLHLQGQAPVLIERLRGRGRVITRHLRLDAEELTATISDDLALAERVAQALTDAEQPVRTVDAAQGEEAVVAATLAHLEAALTGTDTGQSERG